jgi:four helix bundle protein
MGSQEIKSFRDLDVWNVAMDLVVEAYGVAHALPRSEQFELSAQLRRSAVSIASNIAEGHARRGRAYRNHVLIAPGSTAELETQIEAAVRLELLTAAQVRPAVELIARVGQMLHGLARALRRKRLTALGSALAFLGCAGATGLFQALG